MFDPYDFQELVLRSGMKVFCKQLDYASQTNVGVAVAFGGRDGKPGIAHLLEHCLSLQTGKFEDSKQLERSISKAGGTIYLGGTRRSAMLFKGKVPCGREEALFDGLSQLLAKPLFPPEKFELEKSSVLREIVQSVRSVQLVEETEKIKLSAYHQQGRSYARELISRFSILGTPEEVVSISIDDLVGTYQEHFVPSNVVAIVVGNFEMAKLSDLLEKYPFALNDPPAKKWPAPHSRIIDCPLPIYPKAERPQMSLKEFLKSEQEFVDYCAVELNSIVGPGEDIYPNIFTDNFSEMILDLHRKKRGKMYSPYASFYCFDDARHWQSTLFTDPASVELLFEDIQEALSISAHDEKLFNSTKELYLANYGSFDESSTKIMENAMDDVILYGKVIPLSQMKKTASNARFGDFERWAKKLIEAMAVFVIKP